MPEYKIIIENRTGQQGEQYAAGPSGSAMTSAQDEQSFAASISDAKSVFAGLAIAKSAAGTAKKLVSSEIQYQINTVQLRTGSSALQDKYQFAYSVGSFVVNTGASIAMGLAVGGAPGAVVAALTSVANTAIGYHYAQKTLNLQQDVENESIRMNLIRAGTGGNRGRAGTL